MSTPTLNLDELERLYGNTNPHKTVVTNADEFTFANAVHRNFKELMVMAREAESAKAKLAKAIAWIDANVDKHNFVSVRAILSELETKGTPLPSQPNRLRS